MQDPAAPSSALPYSTNHSPTAKEDRGEDDPLLAAQVQRGDTEAFGVLYDRYAPAVYALAAHLLGATDAEEVVQDVFLRLWLRAGQYDPTRSAFGVWFMAIARHRVLDELRHRGQARRLAVAGDVERLLARAPDPSLDPGTEVWQRDAARAVRGALAALPADQRRVLVLGYFGGLTQSVMADRLGWPLGTVKKRVRLGLQKLRRSLAAFADAPGSVPAPHGTPSPTASPPEAQPPASGVGTPAAREPATLLSRGGRRD